MLFHIKKIFFGLTFNLTLFLLLMIGIQNSLNKEKVNLIIGETVNLPISFIIGISFISGSLAGNLITINLANKKK